MSMTSNACPRCGLVTYPHHCFDPITLRPTLVTVQCWMSVNGKLVGRSDCQDEQR